MWLTAVDDSFLWAYWMLAGDKKRREYSHEFGLWGRFCSCCKIPRLSRKMCPRARIYATYGRSVSAGAAPFSGQALRMFVSKRKSDARKSVALVVGVSWRLQRNIRLGHAVLVFRLRCRSLSLQVIVRSSRLGLSPIVVSWESELRLGREKEKTEAGTVN